MKKHCEICGSIENKIMTGQKICINCYNEKQVKQTIEKTIEKLEEELEETEKRIFERNERLKEEKNEIKKIEKIWKDRKRKTEQNMKNYYLIIDEINKKIPNIYKKTLIADELGISKVRLSQILNKKREANGGELINLMIIANIYKFKSDKE